MLNMRPNTLIYGARYDKMMQAFGGYGAYVEDTKDLRGALDELMNFPGPGAGQRQAQPGFASASSRSSAGTRNPLTPHGQGAAPQGAAPFSASLPAGKIFPRDRRFSRKFLISHASRRRS